MDNPSKPLKTTLPDQLTLQFAEHVNVFFTSGFSTNKYLAVRGLAFGFEDAASPVTLALPSSAYWSGVVLNAMDHYTYGTIDKITTSFVPSAFHTGSNWSDFGRNQAVETSSDSFQAVADLQNMGGVRTYEADQGFSLV